MKILLKTIRSFADKDTENFFYGKRVKKWEKIIKKASQVLSVLNSITKLSELELSLGLIYIDYMENAKDSYLSVSINNIEFVLLDIKAKPMK